MYDPQTVPKLMANLTLPQDIDPIPTIKLVSTFIIHMPIQLNGKTNFPRQPWILTHLFGSGFKSNITLLQKKKKKEKRRIYPIRLIGRPTLLSHHLHHSNHSP